MAECERRNLSKFQLGMATEDSLLKQTQNGIGSFADRIHDSDVTDIEPTSKDVTLKGFYGTYQPMGFHKVCI